MKSPKFQKDNCFESEPPSYSLFFVNEDYANKKIGSYTKDQENVDSKNFASEKTPASLEKSKEFQNKNRKGKESDQTELNDKVTLQKLREFASQTTLHGLRYVFDSKPLKIRGYFKFINTNEPLRK